MRFGSSGLVLSIFILACESRRGHLPSREVAGQPVAMARALPPLPDTVTARVVDGLDSMSARILKVDLGARARYADRVAALVRSRWTPPSPPAAPTTRRATVFVNLGADVWGRPTREAVRQQELEPQDSAFAANALATVTGMLAAIDAVPGRPKDWAGCGKHCEVVLDLYFGPDPEQLRRAQIAVAPWPAFMKDRVLAHQVAVGMSADMVRLAWGRPSVTATVTAAGRTEHWDYGTRSVVLANGVVAEIRTSD
jgi:hypothetical protein